MWGISCADFANHSGHTNTEQAGNDDDDVIPFA